jgi:hypothetical protein
MRSIFCEKNTIFSSPSTNQGLINLLAIELEVRIDLLSKNKQQPNFNPKVLRSVMNSQIIYIKKKNSPIVMLIDRIDMMNRNSGWIIESKMLPLKLTS